MNWCFNSLDEEVSKLDGSDIMHGRHEKLYGKPKPPKTKTLDHIESLEMDWTNDTHDRTSVFPVLPQTNNSDLK